MKLFFYYVLMFSLISIGLAKGKEATTQVSGALGGVMKSLEISAEEVENNQVLLVITNLKQIKKKAKLTKVTTFQLYLSATKSVPHESIFALFDYNRFKLVDQKMLMSSKPFLLEIMAKHPEARVQNLAIVTLGMIFPGSPEVLDVFQDQYFFSRASDSRKAAVLKALALGKFQAALIVRSALHSNNLSLVINAAAVVKSNQHLYLTLLPDLVSALLSINPQKTDSQSAHSFLFQLVCIKIKVNTSTSLKSCPKETEAHS